MPVVRRLGGPVRLLVALIACASFAAVVASPLAPAPGSVVEVEHEERLAPREVQKAARASFGRYGPPVIENGVEIYRVRYVTRDATGAPARVSATLFVPVEPPRGEAPLYVFGSGTTGLANACAPSREGELAHPLGDYRRHLAAYAGRGIVTMIPDYLGFEDEDTPQAYFHATSEAHVMLDAARAARTVLREMRWLVDLEPAVVMGGYSQGGHAAFAAADLRPSYAPDVPLRGLIGYGATTDVRPLFEEGPYYAPYVLAAWSSIYGAERVKARKVLDDRYAPALEREALTVCVDRAQQIFPFDADALYSGSFARALRSETMARDFPELHELFDANASGLSGHGLPALVVQGGRDVIVHDATQERFVEALCERGSDVRYLHVPEARHRDTRAAGFDAAVAWIFGRAEGKPAPSSCD